MTEELPLPPDVRATQADALKPLASHWPCDMKLDSKPCELPAAFGNRTTCCQQSVLLCSLHFTHILAELTDARNRDRTLACPLCKEVFMPPVKAGAVFDVSHHLYITGGTA